MGEQQDLIPKQSVLNRWWVQYTAAFFIYCLLSFIGQLPGALHLFDQWAAWFEGSANCYRVWWFSEVIYGGRPGSIWFLGDLLYPRGIPTMMQSNGMGKELLVALFGGGKAPWLSGNLIMATTPITVSFAGFAVARRLVRGAFLPALVAGWFIGWNGTFVGLHITPWLASTEALVVFLFCVMMMRQRGGTKWAIFAGIAAGLAVWLQMQQLVYVVLISLIYCIDRLVRGDWKKTLLMGIPTGIALILAAPLLYYTWASFGGDMEAMSGDTPEFAFFLWRNHLTQFFLPPETSIPLGWTKGVMQGLGTAHAPHPAPYLGWVVLILAFIWLAVKTAGDRVPGRGCSGVDAAELWTGFVVV